MSKSLNAVLLSAAFLVSISVSAQDRKNDTHPQEQHGDSRAYYDSKHRDWHQSNEQETQSYSRYAEEHHLKSHDLSSSREKEQQQYWNWRHKHPDSH